MVAALVIISARVVRRGVACGAAHQVEREQSFVEMQQQQMAMMRQQQLMQQQQMAQQQMAAQQQMGAAGQRR